MTPVFSKEQVEAMKSVMGEAFDETLMKKLEPIVGELVAKNAKDLVTQLRTSEKHGKDIVGLTEKQKQDFVLAAKAAAFGDHAAMAEMVSTKANEALIEETDNRGGFLVS